MAVGSFLCMEPRAERREDVGSEKYHEHRHAPYERVDLIDDINYRIHWFPLCGPRPRGRFPHGAEASLQHAETSIFGGLQRMLRIVETQRERRSSHAASAHLERHGAALEAPTLQVARPTARNGGAASIPQGRDPGNAHGRNDPAYGPRARLRRRVRYSYDGAANVLEGVSFSVLPGRIDRAGGKQRVGQVDGGEAGGGFPRVPLREACRRLGVRPTKSPCPKAPTGC